jgi:hypothetical protein
MPYALCPMPYALCPISSVHRTVTEKGYRSNLSKIQILKVSSKYKFIYSNRHSQALRRISLVASQS